MRQFKVKLTLNLTEQEINRMIKLVNRIFTRRYNLEYKPVPGSISEEDLTITPNITPKPHESALDYRIREWLDEHMELTESFDDRIPSNELFRSFLEHCERVGCKGVIVEKPVVFIRRLNVIHPFNSQWRDGSLQPRGFKKIKFRHPKLKEV